MFVNRLVINQMGLPNRIIRTGVDLYVSQLQVYLYGIVEPETRAPSLSVRKLTVENLLW